ncbi:MAG: hypothetical protein NZ578_01685 [Candidatus Binatia bacterium]|nr:hypothetical protein [Candidatus Binatia bacterium]
MDIDALILTGTAWVVEGELPGEAILARAAQRTIGQTPSFLLSTGPMGGGEQGINAALALQRQECVGVIAPVFAWPFFRVCLNIGLPPLTVWEAGAIRMGDRLRVDVNGLVVKNLSSGARYPIRGLSELYVAILACGGMVGYVRALLAGQRSAISP